MDLNDWPWCAKCCGPVQSVSVLRDPMTAWTRITVTCHGKVEIHRVSDEQIVDQGAPERGELVAFGGQA